jgi:CRISPR/Cas system-associated exonuclease Cas4 (RecB family)
MEKAMNIPTASISKLHVYESCPYRAKLAWVDKIADTQPRKAADRGTAIHQLAEDYVRGEVANLPDELRHFASEFTALRQRYQEGTVSLEGEWGFTEDWQPTDYKSAWLRVKADAVVFTSDTTAVVIDHKTGKRYGNELKHAEQLQLYAISALIRNPQLKLVNTELWYLDQDDLADMPIKAVSLQKYIKVFDKRFKAMTEDTTFVPKPNINSCKWCPYHASKQGNCQHGIKNTNAVQAPAVQRKPAR